MYYKKYNKKEGKVGRYTTRGKHTTYSAAAPRLGVWGFTPSIRLKRLKKEKKVKEGRRERIKEKKEGRTGSNKGNRRENTAEQKAEGGFEGQILTTKSESLKWGPVTCASNMGA